MASIVKTARFRLAFFAPFLLLLACIVPAACAQLGKFPTSELVIETAKGPRHFRIEVARSPEQHELGLMYRSVLAADAGMLFEFDRPDTVAFWMKNTLIPLDMLFIAADGRITDIHERAEPLSLAPIAPAHPVLAVLELNGGIVESLGIKPGDRVRHGFFHGQP